jgi:hypothetical protein
MDSLKWWHLGIILQQIDLHNVTQSISPAKLLQLCCIDQWLGWWISEISECYFINAIFQDGKLSRRIPEILSYRVVLLNPVTSKDYIITF